MRKLIRLFLSIIMFAFVVNVNAQELTYSEWSTMYPSGLDEKFIESEVRYNWYKVVDGRVEYIDEYYSELDGYIKDEPSARTYYRYITNEYIVLNGYNEIVVDVINYCQNEYCYKLVASDYTLVETVGKDTIENPYENTEMIEVDSVATPYTGDNVLKIVISLTLSLLILLSIIILKKKKKIFN